MPVVTATTTVIALVKSGAASKIKSTAKNILRGLTRKGCSSSQKKERDELALMINDLFNPGDYNIVKLAKERISPTASDIAYFVMGGNDCKHKNVSKEDQIFLDEFWKRLEKRAGELESLNSQGSPEGQSVYKKESQIMASVPGGKNTLIGLGALVGLGIIAYLVKK